MGMSVVGIGGKDVRGLRREGDEQPACSNAARLLQLHTLAYNLRETRLTV